MTVDTLFSEITPSALSRQPAARLRRIPWSGLVVWVVLLVLIIVPVVTFVLVAISPRLFHQGTSYFTLSNISTAFSGYTGRGIVDSLWVSTLVGIFAVGFATAIA